MSPTAKKIAALKALAVSTTFEGERANALAAIAKLRESEAAEKVEDEEAREWARTMDAAESDRIIAAMVDRAYRHLCGRGWAVYRDARAFVVVRADGVEPIEGGDVLRIAINNGFTP